MACDGAGRGSVSGRGRMGALLSSPAYALLQAGIKERGMGRRMEAVERPLRADASVRAGAGVSR